MINKKMIIVIAIFIATGFLVFSFAATPQGETVDNNGDSSTNSTDNKTNTDNKNGTTSGTKDKDKDKDTKKDNDVSDNIIGSLNNQNDTQNTILNNTTNNTGNGTISGGNQWASGNTGTTTPSGNNGGSSTTPSGNNNNQTNTNNPSGGNTSDNKPGNGGTTPTEPEVNVDEMTGPSVFVSDSSNDSNGVNITPSVSGNTVTYTGEVKKAYVDDFGVYYVNIVVRAPYKYSQDVLKNATIVTPFGDQYNASSLQYDAAGYAYFSYSQGFVNAFSSEFYLTVNWGIGENLVYTLKSNINVVD